MGVSVYVGGSMKGELPWKYASLLKRHLRMERLRRGVLVACPASFGTRSLRGSGYCSKMRKRSWGNCKMLSGSTRSRKFPKPAGYVLTVTGSEPYMIIGRECRDALFGRFQVEAPRIRRRACNARSGAFLGGSLSPLAHFFRTGRPRNCNAFRLNSGRDIPFGKRPESWKPSCFARSS